DLSRVRRRGKNAPRSARGRAPGAAGAAEHEGSEGHERVIDLHTHTTASDGRLSPVELVARARSAGVTVLSVTDHDTVAGADAADAACRECGIAFVTGIEITAIREGLDVHVLGYFVDCHSPALDAFLTRMRKQRIDRIRQMVDRLAQLGMAL